MEMQSWWRERQERQPVRFMETEALPALKVTNVSLLYSPCNADYVPQHMDQEYHIYMTVLFCYAERTDKSHGSSCHLSVMCVTH